jgi:hypothetical protein
VHRRLETGFAGRASTISILPFFSVCVQPNNDTAQQGIRLGESQFYNNETIIGQTQQEVKNKQQKKEKNSRKAMQNKRAAFLTLDSVVNKRWKLHSIGGNALLARRSFLT